MKQLNAFTDVLFIFEVAFVLAHLLEESRQGRLHVIEGVAKGGGVLLLEIVRTLIAKVEEAVVSILVRG